MAKNIHGEEMKLRIQKPGARSNIERITEEASERTRQRRAALVTGTSVGSYYDRESLAAIAGVAGQSLTVVLYGLTDENYFDEVAAKSIPERDKVLIHGKKIGTLFKRRSP